MCLTLINKTLNQYLHPFPPPPHLPVPPRSTLAASHSPHAVSLIRLYILFLILAILPITGHSQKNPDDNLVPNPGFEEFSDYPLEWYYSGRDFSRVSLYWTSPTAASPDIYAPTVKIPPTWKAHGFGKLSPAEGKSYAGITVYGCGGGKPHCREYVQIHLAEALVPGQRYGFACRIAHLQKSVSVANIGLWFSEHELDEFHTEPLVRQPVLEIDKFIPSDGRWHRWTGHFTAESSAPFLVIGNFADDPGSTAKMPVRSDLRYGYYFLDDVRLFKIPPFLPEPLADSPLRNYKPRIGEIVTLSRIYFEHDRADFLPRAVVQLEQLLDFMRRYPKMHIEIIGHTDIVGTPEYNYQLSIRRSKAVLAWLVGKGIDTRRLAFAGYGSTQPVATNETSLGRSQNRRVEIKVISL